MLNWLKRKSAPPRYVGIDLYEDGFAVAVLQVNAETSARVTAARWCANAPGQGFAAQLGGVIRGLGARGLPAVVTLRHASYSLVQLETPQIPEEELADAMRWRIRDLIDFPVEQAVVDLIHLPQSHRPGAPRLLYVVVAREDDVKAVADALDTAGLEIAAIDIVEMAIRNLAMHIDRPERPRAYLHMQPGQTVIEIADRTQVFLGRRVQQDFDSAADPVLLQAQMENLALEVQRSLDYFESQYAVGPVDRLTVIACDDALYAAIAGVAASFLTVPVSRFAFSGLEVADGIELADLGRGVTALGAAMRGLPWAA